MNVHEHSRAWRIAAIACAALAAGVVRVMSLDTPWYLRAGEEILARGALPATDPFSYTSAQPWLNHEWLAEVLLALAYRAAGFVGVGMIVAALVAAAVGALMLVPARRAFVGLEVLAGAAALLLVREAAQARAQVFSYALFAATLALCMVELRRPSRLLYLAWPLQLAWTQLHGGNPTGVALLGALVLAAPSRRSVLVAAGAAILTCAGPYGIDVHAHYLGARHSLPQIREWQPLSRALAHHSVGDWWFVALAVVAAAVLAVRWRRKEPVRFEALALALFSAVAIKYARFSTEAGMVAAAVLAKHLGALEVSARARRLALPAAAAVVLAGIAVSPQEVGFGLAGGRFPVGAAAYLRAHRPPGPMFNSYNFGGYLLWAYPGEKVFIDGRAFTVYSDAHLGSLLEAYDQPERFRRLEARWGFRLAVLQRAGRGARLAAWLGARGDWRVVYEDALAVVMVRSAKPTAAGGSGTSS